MRVVSLIWSSPASPSQPGLPEDGRQALREALFERLGRPTGGFRLSAMARAGRGVLHTEPPA